MQPGYVMNLLLAAMLSMVGIGCSKPKTGACELTIMNGSWRGVAYCKDDFTEKACAKAEPEELAQFHQQMNCRGLGYDKTCPNSQVKFPTSSIPEIFRKTCDP